MNAKEARETVESIRPRGKEPKIILDYPNFGKWIFAKGYLAALEGPEVLALLDALEQVVKEFPQYTIEKALAQFKEAVGEK